MSAAGTEAVDDALFEAIQRRTEPTPDGIQNVNGNVWTGQSRLKQEASKGNVPCSRDEISEAVDRLLEADRVVSWHGLLAPATDEHLAAIIENEVEADVTRSLLVGKANKLRGVEP
ncbi:hypothetical protein A6E15_19365 [Natrinema saccharevitans]|uniref:Uncharacterized protein n=1 Tax=Natrinema saccharevitans TaxID=301967 RepID=A0A1S8ARF9_9EURY|nr:hypothetical protein [Natrinema saccharevitans]OLZ39124.1 hypothetical protein A6E15_19365 [Natrinema saccharevitans]